MSSEAHADATTPTPDDEEPVSITCGVIVYAGFLVWLALCAGGMWAGYRRGTRPCSRRHRPLRAQGHGSLPEQRAGARERRGWVPDRLRGCGRGAFEARAGSAPRRAGVLGGRSGVRLRPGSPNAIPHRRVGTGVALWRPDRIAGRPCSPRRPTSVGSGLRDLRRAQAGRAPPATEGVMTPASSSAAANPARRRLRPNV